MSHWVSGVLRRKRMNAAGSHRRMASSSPAPRLSNSRSLIGRLGSRSKWRAFPVREGKNGLEQNVGA
jgi:hypothetical protein